VCVCVCVCVCVGGGGGGGGGGWGGEKGGCEGLGVAVQHAIIIKVLHASPTAWHDR